MGNLFSSKIAANMSGTQAQFVREAIKKDQVVIFSKSYCPYCKMAKEQFEKLKKSFGLYELDQMEEAEQIQAVLGEMTGASSVPRVFVNGDFIGGGTDVKKMYEDGSLQKLLS